ncbi:EmrB/QacA subfamily drug resistance transporter [Nocardia tenerifensis]|uniref:EmrB/QacA subfamily drug resistance transporter n=1 Tax=Nocardia tenerifensis TaxID=228006 RepID=A0A318K7X1_9NOCA|nr:MFS transporter [Nocardia tenerifensis]PXX59888.1 EmrB/QacA subfamily drug resistance transporter [Nocardia tenerifensis]
MATTTHSSPATAKVTGRMWAVLAVILAADGLDLLDSTITNIAAPAIAEDLRGGQSLIQWLGASYALALGVLLVVGGRLGDRFGKRRLFLIGLAGFTAASVACGLAFDPTSIITARLAQGAFGALLIPQGFGILTAVFPREHLGKAFSVFGPVLGLSAVGGPILAGFLIDADLFGFGWRATFLINIVLGGGAFAAACRLLPSDSGDDTVAIDGLGAALLGAGMFGALFGLIDGSAHGWRAGPLGYLATGLVCFGLFARRQLTAANPLIRPTLFKNRGFTSGLLLGLVFFAAVSGLLYVLSLFLQTGLGYTPTGAALGLAPVAVGIVLSSLAAHRFIARLGRTLILIGLLITLTGTGLLLVLAGVTDAPWALAGPILILGLGMGTCFGTIYQVTIGDIEQAETGSASGSLTAVQQLANAVGAAAVTTVYFHAVGSGQVHALTISLILVAAITLASCGLVGFLPRNAPVDH